MKRLIEIYSYGNNAAALKEVVEVLDKNGVIAIPTDSGYALACKMKSKKGIDKIIKIRDLDSSHNFTLICKDLSEISEYAKVDNNAYRFLKRYTPGAFTFILNATKKVSSLLVTKSKNTVGIRVSDHYIAQAIADELGEPLVVSSFILPGNDLVVTDCSELDDEVTNHIDLIVESEYCGYESTTVVNMLELPYGITRQGAGEIDA
ncbi:L-threonylcarbamoyladenylate synthase [Francisella adeliensis]|uniref:Threonylcarbamoyl-AMP synthase n=1 Tax=Francisella adeliensis TaxID=2007306 RepID=A0A2Z4XXV2_9GAMM|nr:L-threonylcarbamoyladenylate synthase [Francisella adeliensis]AXA33235.1 threonylcarbamoyl-AMP synthase [Francisella adeliensis]MBK2085044.1 threonylcarbamoyl-AMP synthase [Francisella adeliensis]MBK2096965.1 threonylcarbamoyl-AMP synthase [Francisella adeliensis]QIW11461.1 threonylcarbamoyl-AMP synthase [Francisella adeliensis]QIW13336.1 threonylcarbamoyl-AMP synthase [Francisella adeliensis]